MTEMIMTGLNVFWKTKKVVNRLVYIRVLAMIECVIRMERGNFCTVDRPLPVARPQGETLRLIESTENCSSSKKCLEGKLVCFC
jgi:hypothetical protein